MDDCCFANRPLSIKTSHTLGRSEVGLPIEQTLNEAGDADARLVGQQFACPYIMGDKAYLRAFSIESKINWISKAILRRTALNICLALLAIANIVTGVLVANGHYGRSLWPFGLSILLAILNSIFSSEFAYLTKHSTRGDSYGQS